MVEPTSAALLKTAVEITKDTAEIATKATESLSPILEKSSPEAKGAIQSQLVLYNDCGRPPTRIERIAFEEINDSVAEQTIDGKRKGLVGEMTRERIAQRAEQAGKIKGIEREPQFGSRRLDLRYQAARDIFVRDQLSGQMEPIKANQWIAEEVKNRNIASLARETRGRLVEQISAAMNADHHVILTVRKEILSSAEGRAVLEDLTHRLEPLMKETGKHFFIKGRDLGHQLLGVANRNVVS